MASTAARCKTLERKLGTGTEIGTRTEEREQRDREARRRLGGGGLIRDNTVSSVALNTIVK